MDAIVNESNLLNVSNKYADYEIQFRQLNDSQESSEYHLPLKLSSCISLFSSKNTHDMSVSESKDDELKYYSSNNADFINETGLSSVIKAHDAFIKPPLLCNYSYDYIFASKNANTPLAYELNYRTYYTVTQENVRVKLCPPKYAKYLSVSADYENMEFKSNINVWNAETSKVKFMEIELNVGDTIFIPPYWLYSFFFPSEKASMVCYKYRTYMNNVAIANHYLLHFLQLQNIKCKRPPL